MGEALRPTSAGSCTLPEYKSHRELYICQLVCVKQPSKAAVRFTVVAKRSKVTVHIY